MPAELPKSQRTAAQNLNTVMTELDPLTAPFNSGGDVDLLLHDLAAPTRPAASAAGRSAHRAAVAARRGGAGRRVLVVDSTPIARKFLALRLQALGYEVHLAENGDQAFEIVEQQAFDIVFLEVALAPKNGIDGLGLCQAIKHKPDHRRGIAPAVVMVTGMAGSADRVRGSLAGCDAYLTKPLVDAELIAALSEVDPRFN